MNKKILFSTILACAICFMFSFSAVFASNTNPVDGIRNFVGDAENTVEDAAGGISNGIRNTTGDMTDSSSNMGSMDNRNGNKNETAGILGNDGTNNGDYTATRTATTTEPTLAGINMTTWAWIILAVAAIGIITLIWSYLAQNKNNYDSYNE